ncbi:MAG: hypothetical protein A2144_00280 [Chloroflexi bacterium RBG_16_50_9]|nr:MAG: hypothetical protein A2144_00280 [Chloroflexi bacterium RBG_16_50_9]
MKPEFLRFHQLARQKKRYDYHIHTSWSDGRATVREFIMAALDKDMEAIAFTEHVRRTSTWFDSFIDEVKGLREKNTRLQIYVGIEAKALDFQGSLDANAHTIKRAEIVLGAVHRYPDNNGGYLDFQELSPDEASKIEFGLACALLKNPCVDVLAHPGGVFERLYHTAFPGAYLEEIVNIANQQSKTIEINSSYLKDFSYHLALFSKLNPLISLGSDAHHPAELDGGCDILAGF